MAAFVRLLGAPSVHIGEAVHDLLPGRRTAALLYLAFRRDWVARDELLYLFWPDSEEHKARANLRQLVRALRASPLAPGLEVQRRRLRWQVNTDLQAPTVGDAAAPTTPLLQGFRLPEAPQFEEWLELERAAREEGARSELLEFARRAQASSDAEEAVSRLRGWLVDNPLDEEIVHQYLLSCRSTGRAAEGIRSFEAFEQRLARELVLEPSPRLRRAYLELKGDQLVASGPSVQLPAQRRAENVGQLPAPRTSFVGRQGELARLVGALARPRAATCQIMGAGGMGKTRLALEVAARLFPAFLGQVVYVPLVEARTPEEALAAIALAARSDAGGAAAPFDRVVASLRRRRVLVVLDNLEQIAGIEPSLDRLREALPQAAWLLTARRRLGLEAVELVELEGLPLARRDGSRHEGSAADLFLQRARGLGVELADDTDQLAVAELVSSLGGMPLAIELAAAWARVLPISRLVEMMGRGTGLPAPPGEQREARHVSVESALQASWELLNAPQRDALARLSVFRDGCTVAAADAVAGVRLPMLAALRDASMLSLSRSGRLSHHPLLERFLGERVALGNWDLSAIRSAHSGYYLRFAKRLEDLGQGGYDEAIDELQAEHGNIEAAWAWAVDHQQWRPVMQAGGAVLGQSYAYAGRPEGWARLMGLAAERAPRDSLEWAVLSAFHAGLDTFDGRYESAYRQQLVSRDVARRFDEPFHRAWVLYHFAESANGLGRWRESIEALEEADRLLESIDEVNVRGLINDGLYARAATRAQSELRYRVCEQVARRSDDPNCAMGSLSVRAFDLALIDGRYPEGLRASEAATALMRRRRWQALDLPGLLCREALVRLCIGDLEVAMEKLEVALEMGRPFADSYLDHRWTVDLLARASWHLSGPAAAEAVLAGPDAKSQPAGVGALMLGAEIALAEGEVSVARRRTTAALAIPRPGTGRFATLADLELGLLGARLSLAEGREQTASQSLVASITAAIEHDFVPASLAALQIAAPLLPESLAKRAQWLVARHPATHFEVRSRLVDTLGQSQAQHGERAALEPERVAVLAEVAEYLTGATAA